VLKNLRFYDAFLLLYFLENNLSFSQIGILYAAKEILTNLLEIPSGLISDSYGRKHSLLLALLLYILSFLCFYFSDKFYLLLIAMCTFGIGDAFRSGTHKGLIIDYLRIQGWENEKINYYGHTRSWSQIGSALSALIAGVLVFYSGSYKDIFLLTIIPYSINLANIYSYPNELNYPINEKTKKRSSFSANIRKLIYAFKQRSVLSIVNSSSLHSAFLKSIKDYIQTIMLSLALAVPIFSHVESKSKSGLVIGLIYFLIYLLNSLASRNADKILSTGIKRIDRKTLLLGITMGLITGTLYYFDFVILSILSFMLIYIIESARKPILTGYLSDSVPGEILSSAFSVQAFYTTIVTSLLALSLGILADYFGVGIALVIISIIVLIPALVIRFDASLKTEM